jgi:hypothetical protein
MNLNWLIDGTNMAFALPLGLALVYLGLYVASGVTFGDAGGDVDADADADSDTDADHDVHVDADHPAHGAVHDVVHYDPSKPEGLAATSFSLFSYFGVGRIPVSMWLSGLLLGWGGFGLAAMPVVKSYTALEPSVATAILFIVAAMGALVTTRGLTVLLTRVIPLNETYARRRHELLGSEGEAIYPIDGAFGMAGIRDERGGLFQVGCRAETGEPIAKGTRVKLVAYNRDTNLYHVVPAGQK